MILLLCCVLRSSHLSLIIISRPLVLEAQLAVVSRSNQPLVSSIMLSLHVNGVHVLLPYHKSLPSNKVRVYHYQIPQHCAANPLFQTHIQMYLFTKQPAKLIQKCHKSKIVSEVPRVTRHQSAKTILSPPSQRTKVQ